MGDLADLRRDLVHMLDNNEPVQHAVGLFGKETALDVVAQDLGGDRMFSGWKRRVALNAGYDTGTPVVLNLRPAGMWLLAEHGRRRNKTIRPKRGRKGRNGRPAAVLTARGFRASSRSTSSRGLNTITTVEDRIEAGIEQAAADGVAKMLKANGF